MRNHFFFILSLLLLSSCTHWGPVGDRGPSSMPSVPAGYYGASFVFPSAQLIDKQKESDARKNPWKYFLSNDYCEKNFQKIDNEYTQKFPLTFVQEIEVGQLKNFALNSNLEAFNALACNSEMKKISSELMDEFATPIYTPRITAQNGEVKVAGYLVTAFPSMLEYDKLSVYVKSLAEAPKFDLVKNEYIKNMASLYGHQAGYGIGGQGTGAQNSYYGNYGNYDYSMQGQAQLDLPEYIIKTIPSDLFDKEYCVQQVLNTKTMLPEDQFMSFCLGDASPPQIIKRGEEYWIFYKEYDPKYKANNFVLKRHILNKKNVLEQLQDVYDASESDVTVWNFTHGESENWDGDQIALPMQYYLFAIDDKTIRLSYNSVLGNKSRIFVYDVSNDFKEQKQILKYDAPESVITVLDQISAKKLYVQYSGHFKGIELEEFNLETGARKPFANSFLTKKHADEVETSLFLYSTKDGKKFPLFISRLKGFKNYAPKNFGVLNSYGGFNQLSDYRTRASAVDWPILKRGGFVATAVIRGGGELGPKEWKAAYGTNRNKSFEDLISATEFLNRKGFAPIKRVALKGGSNGGLLVLATAGLRPDLYGAVVAVSPVVDVKNIVTLDYARGKYWERSDYGKMSSPEVQKFWDKYSPLSSFKKAKDLPPILVRTGHDDPNVSPIHALQLQSLLKSRKDGSKFHLIYLPIGSGHYAGTIRQTVEEESYFDTFILKSLNVPF